MRIKTIGIIAVLSITLVLCAMACNSEKVEKENRESDMEISENVLEDKQKDNKKEIKRDEETNGLEMTISNSSDKKNTMSSSSNSSKEENNSSKDGLSSNKGSVTTNKNNSSSSTTNSSSSNGTNSSSSSTTKPSTNTGNSNSGNSSSSSSTSGSNSSSSGSNSGNDNNSGTTSSGNAPSTPTHTHTWEEVKEEVVVEEAWVEEVKAWRTLCNGCKEDITDLGDEGIINHTFACGGASYANYYMTVYTIPHDAVVEEQVVGYKCSCGATK